MDEWRAQGDTLRERSAHWAEHSAALLDAQRYAAFCAAHLSDDVLLRVGMDVQLSGRHAVMQWLDGTLRQLGRSTHRIIGITSDEHAIVVESEVSYFREGERPAAALEVVSYRLRGDRASRVILHTTHPPPDR